MKSLIHPWASHVHALKRRHPGHPVLSEPGTFISWPSWDGWWWIVVNSSWLIGCSSVKARLQVMIISTSTPDVDVKVAAAAEFSWSRFSSCWWYSFMHRAYETEDILPCSSIRDACSSSLASMLRITWHSSRSRWWWNTKWRRLWYVVGPYPGHQHGPPTKCWAWSVSPQAAPGPSRFFPVSVLRGTPSAWWRSIPTCPAAGRYHAVMSVPPSFSWLGCYLHSPIHGWFHWLMKCWAWSVPDLSAPPGILEETSPVWREYSTTTWATPCHGSIGM